MIDLILEGLFLIVAGLLLGTAIFETLLFIADLCST